MGVFFFFVSGLFNCVKCLINYVDFFIFQAKESWEMDTKEKLEQSAIVKDKGTKYFKVIILLQQPSKWPHLFPSCEECF